MIADGGGDDDDGDGGVDDDSDAADEQRVRGQHLHDGHPQDGVLAPAAGGGEYSTVQYSTVQYSTVSSPRLQGVVSQVLLLPRTDAGVAGGLRVGVHAGGGAAGRVRRQQALGEAPLMM